jgi:ribonuclease PH
MSEEWLFTCHQYQNNRGKKIKVERPDNRKHNELREISIEKNYTKYAHGSVLFQTGNTKVLCTVMVEDRVPPFLRGEGTGWVTAEYNMLPSSTQTRKGRDRNKGKIDGRTVEIQRLIGRSLRSVIDLAKLGERTLWVDCDVLQADGGTRTASITGAFIALKDTVKKLIDEEIISENPIKENVAAVSVGVIDGVPLLDIEYVEDSIAEVDMNVIMTETGEFIEVQGTGEKRPYTREEFNTLISLAEDGINTLIKCQKEVEE